MRGGGIMRDANRPAGAALLFAGAISFAAISIALLAAPARCARLGDAEIGAHLAEAEQAFRRGMELDASDPDSARACYVQAILHFERIVNDGGMRNGPLFYDIGNAYFRAGDIGRAILNYKRASLYMANDQNLQQNLEYARNRRADRIEVKQREQVYRTLFFIHYDIPSRMRLGIFAASFAALWIAAAIRLFTRAGVLKIIIAVGAVVSAVFLASLLADAVARARAPEGVITANEVTGRMGDADTYQPSFKEPLHAGTEFRLIERRAGWWQVELDNGERTWIPGGTAELVID
jgi:tetratricopeptide (TPR) repeat protein